MKTKATKAATALALAIGFGTGPALAGDGITVEHLGTNNTLVRVSSDSRYLMLPIQESNEDATVNIVVDGRLDRTIYARMAKTKVDYTVPFDLSPYKGHDVILNIVTSQNRSTVREAKQDVCWTNFSLTDTTDTSNREKYRPAFHHTPLYGWMNDPNGMFCKDGVWHLYYQWNPYGSKWQNMTWGHSSSTDLINWTHHQAAIEPDGLGTVFSGSAAIDRTGSAGTGENSVVALFTSAGVSQIQSFAYSHDNGTTFTRYAGNPVLTLESEARDPNMFFNEESGEWTIVLAHPLEKEMLIFSSPDLKEWSLRSSFGKGLGAQDGVWECPDLFPLHVDGTDTKKWVLLCNINPGGPFGGSGTQYFVGDFDGSTFTPDTDSQGNVPTKWLDFGKDNYATVSWSDAPDSRRSVIGWMSNWQYAAEVPTMQFRSANTLPRDLSLFTSSDGGLYVASAPSPELLSLRAGAPKKVNGVKLSKKGKSYILPSANDGICEIEMDLEPGKAETIGITLSNNEGETVSITYNRDDDTVAMDRRNSGIVDFSQDFPAVTVAPAYSSDGRLTLRMFIDRSSIEMFCNGGRSVMTNLLFPTSPYTTLTVNSPSGPARIRSLSIYPVKPSENI